MTHPKLERGRPRLWFYLYLAHRVNIAAHPGMAILTVLAVAAATALAVGVEIASRAVREELHETARAILGNADLEVVAGNRGIPEELIEKVAAVPGVFEASPVITQVVRVSGGPLDGMALNLLGVDLLAKRQMRDLQVTRDRVTIRDPLRLLVNPTSVVIAASLATRLGVKEGETFRVALGGRHELRVEGLIEPGGLGDAYNGQMGVMDVWSLQQLVGARGYVDRIEVTAAADSDASALMGAIRERVDGVATTREAIERESYAAAWLGVLDLTAWGAAAISVFVAALLAYTAISHMVDRRMPDFALMQCAGMDHLGVQFMISMQGLLLSIVGGALGLVAGVVASPLVMTAFSRFSEQLQHLRIDSAGIGLGTLVAGTLVCLALAALASAPHALRARTSHPLDLATAYRRAPREVTKSKRVLVMLVAFAGATSAIWWAPAPASFRLAGVVVFGLAGVGALGIRVLPLVAQVLRRGLSGARPGALLLGATLPTRSASLAASLALIASLTLSATLLIIVVESIVETMAAEVAARYGDGVVVRSIPAAAEVRDTISPETVRLVRDTPGVKDVAEYYDTQLLLNGEEFDLRALESEPVFRNATMLVETTAADEMRTALRRGELLVSPGFLRTFGVAVGDEVTLDTPAGSRSFRIGGTARGFAGPNGFAYVDIHTFDKHFRRTGAGFLALWADRPLPGVLDEVTRRTTESETLFFEAGEAFRHAARRVANRFAGMLYALLALAGFLSGIGVMAVVASAVVARREELALMQVAGATPTTIAVLVLADLILLLIVAALPGVLLGATCADVMAALFRESFGSSLDMQFAPGRVGLAVGTLVACAAAAALGPAWTATRAELPSALPRQ